MGGKIASLLTGAFTGYFLGVSLGFVLFHPDLDVWALLGAVLAIAGLPVGLTRWFRRRMHVGLAALIGYILATVAAILLFDDPVTGGMVEALRDWDGGLPLILAGTAAGMFVGARWLSERHAPLLLAFFGGGFVGGYLFGFVLGLAPYPSPVGYMPAILLSGAAAALLTAVIRRRAQPAAG